MNDLEPVSIYFLAKCNLNFTFVYSQACQDLEILTYSGSQWDVVVDPHEPCNQVPKSRASSRRLVWEIWKILQCTRKVCQERYFLFSHGFICEWKIQGSSCLMKPIAQEFWDCLDLLEPKSEANMSHLSFLTFKCPRGPFFAPQGTKLKYLLSTVIIVQTSCELKFPKLGYSSELSKSR